MGMGTATVQTQHAAELLGLPMEKVQLRVRRQHTCRGRAWPAARRKPSASRSRCSKLRKNCCKELLSLAKKDPDTSVLKDASVDDVRLANEGIFRKDTAHRRRNLRRDSEAREKRFRRGRRKRALRWR